MLRAGRTAAQECAKLDVTGPSARRSIRDMLDEGMPALRVSGEVPTVPVGAGVYLSRFHVHGTAAPNIAARIQEPAAGAKAAGLVEARLRARREHHDRHGGGDPARASLPRRNRAAAASGRRRIRKNAKIRATPAINLR